jgi:biopolymer transport protein ExbD
MRRGGLIIERVKGEPTLPLINIVFLMLIFFLVAAQLARPLDAELQLAETDDPNLVPPPDALVLRMDGTLIFRGVETSPDQVITILQEEPQSVGELNLRLIPDRRGKATDLVATVQALRTAGATSVFVVTERAVQ